MIRSNRNLFRAFLTRVFRLAMDYLGPDLSLRFWSVYIFEPTTPTRSFNALMGYNVL